MRPSDYLHQFGHQKNIAGLQNILFDYLNENGDDVEQMKAIIDRKNPDQETLQQINEFELQVRIAEDAIKKWREELSQKD